MDPSTDFDDGQQTQDDEPNWLKNLRREHEATKRELNELRPLREENAMLGAGIDMKHELAEMFRATYKGDWTTEAVSEAAKQYAKYGLLGADQSQGTDTPDPVVDAARRIEHAVAQGVPPVQTQASAGLGDAKTSEEFIARYRAAGGVIAD